MKRLGIILGIVVVMIGLAGCSKPANEDSNGNLFYNKDNECTEEAYCDFVNDMRDDFIDYRDAIADEISQWQTIHHITEEKVIEYCNEHISEYVTDCGDTSKGAGSHVDTLAVNNSRDEFQASVTKDVIITILDHKESSKEIKIKIEMHNTYEYTTYFKY